MATIPMPEPERVGAWAARILDAMRAHPGYDRLRGSLMRYSTCWATFTGYPLVSRWSLERTVMNRMQAELGVVFPHTTELERFDYIRGCRTDDYYAAAGWGERPLRYWLDSAEVTRRLAILNSHYGRASLGPDGRSHDFGPGVLPGCARR